MVTSTVGLADGAAAAEPAGDGATDVAVHAVARTIAKGTKSSRRSVMVAQATPDRSAGPPGDRGVIMAGTQRDEAEASTARG